MINFGEQPAKEILQRRELTITGIARLFGTSQFHLSRVLNGHAIPTTYDRMRLTALLDRPESELFTEDALSARPRIHRNKDQGTEEIG